MNKRPELDCKNPPGQIVNYPTISSSLPESKRGTLGEYIDKTLKHEAMLDRLNKKKLSFDEWIDENENASAEAIWIAAQENV